MGSAGLRSRCACGPGLILRGRVSRSGTGRRRRRRREFAGETTDGVGSCCEERPDCREAGGDDADVLFDGGPDDVLELASFDNACQFKNSAKGDEYCLPATSSSLAGWRVMATKRMIDTTQTLSLSISQCAYQRC